MPIRLSSLTVQAQGQNQLSPAQQRFNALLARIALLSGHIERLQDWSDGRRYAHAQALSASVLQAQAHRKSLLLGLHERLQTADFTGQQQRMARDKLRSLIAELSGCADPLIQALANVYVSEEDTREAAQAQAEAAQALRERIEESLGQPIDKASQYRTPEEMMAAGMRQWQRQQAVHDARKAAKRAARKASQKNAAIDQGVLPPALAREADARNTLRTLFRQLASALHPDRETDEAERLRKTGLMSEVNAAYEKKDLTTLLRLQMQATQANPQQTARMGDKTLLAMSLLLKEQVVSLENDLNHLESRLSRELCVTVHADADEASLDQALQRLLALQRQSVDSLASDVRLIQNDAEFKRWLKAQWQLAKETRAQA